MELSKLCIFSLFRSTLLRLHDKKKSAFNDKKPSIHVSHSKTVLFLKPPAINSILACCPLDLNPSGRKSTSASSLHLRPSHHVDPRLYPLIGKKAFPRCDYPQNARRPTLVFSSCVQIRSKHDSCDHRGCSTRVRFTTLQCARRARTMKSALLQGRTLDW